MNVRIWWRLALMMFLEYAIWGAWSPVLSAYLTHDLKFTGAQTGQVYAMLPLATIVAPMIFGQLADRYVPTQWLLAVLNLAGAGLLWLLAGVTQFRPFLLTMLAFSVLFAPTLVLTNSISFTHLKNSEKEFGWVRVGGTLGWMAAGFSLTRWLVFTQQTSQVDCLRLAAFCSLALGLFCFALPHTPPRREGADALAFVKAFRLLKDPNVLVFMLISFVVATELMFYYVLTAPFLQDLGVNPADTSSVLIIAQGAEAVVMALVLPYVLPRWGVRKVMVIGILAWPLRYAIFALAGFAGGGWLPVVEASLTLHGFCYVFFFVVGFIYIDSVAPVDIRHSAQSLYGVITMGLGLALGSTLAGWLEDRFTGPAPISGGTAPVHWGQLFLVPCALTVLCAIIFPLIFKDRRADQLVGASAMVTGQPILEPQ